MTQRFKALLITSSNKGTCSNVHQDREIISAHASTAATIHSIQWVISVHAASSCVALISCKFACHKAPHRISHPSILVQLANPAAIVQ
jgi:hypothetical protein